MFGTVLIVVALVALFSPLALLPAAGLWVWRNGQTLPKARRITFVVGLVASVLGYVTLFVLRWYFRNAHLGFWPEVRVMGDVAALMVLTELFGFAAGCLGRGYGRIAECVASVLIAVTWFFSAVASF